MTGSVNVSRSRHAAFCCGGGYPQPHRADFERDSGFVRVDLGVGMEIAFAALALSILCNVAAAVFVRRALPAAIVRDHHLIRVEMERMSDQLEGLQTRWAAKVIELTNLADECASHMERAESKRRRVVGAESRAKAQHGDGVDLNTPEGARAAARAAGLM